MTNLMRVVIVSRCRDCPWCEYRADGDNFKFFCRSCRWPDLETRNREILNLNELHIDCPIEDETSVVQSEVQQELIDLRERCKHLQAENARLTFETAWMHH